MRKRIQLVEVFSVPAPQESSRTRCENHHQACQSSSEVVQGQSPRVTCLCLVIAERNHILPDRKIQTNTTVCTNHVHAGDISTTFVVSQPCFLTCNPRFCDSAPRRSWPNTENFNSVIAGVPSRSVPLFPQKSERAARQQGDPFLGGSSNRGKAIGTLW